MSVCTISSPYRQCMSLYHFRRVFRKKTRRHILQLQPLNRRIHVIKYGKSLPLKFEAGFKVIQQNKRCSIFDDESFHAPSSYSQQYDLIGLFWRRGERWARLRRHIGCDSTIRFVKIIQLSQRIKKNLLVVVCTSTSIVFIFVHTQ